MGFGNEWKLGNIEFETAILEFCGFAVREAKNGNKYQVAVFCGCIDKNVGDFVCFDNKIKNGGSLARKYGKNGEKLLGKIVKVTKLENGYFQVEE